MDEFEYDRMRLRVQGYIARRAAKAERRRAALNDPRLRPGILAEISRRQMRSLHKP